MHFKVIGIQLRQRRVKLGMPTDDGIGVYFVKKHFPGYIFRDDEEAKLDIQFDGLTQMHLLALYIGKRKVWVGEVNPIEIQTDPVLVIRPATNEEAGIT